MFSRRQILWNLMLAGLLGLNVLAAPAAAQEPPLSAEPPWETIPVQPVWPDAPEQSRPGGVQIVPADAPPVAEAPASSGGPDSFGYGWTDAFAMSWIDASAGANTGLTSTSNTVTGSISIGFPFKFYENTYSNLYVSRHGLLGFNSNLYYSSGRVPSAGTPNNVIAAYWTYLMMDAASKVTYLAGGSAPNRYFVVQWSQVRDSMTGTLFTFQVVLWENGDITLQYLSMTYGPSGRYCAAIGIEDAYGTDGLAYLGSTCPYASSGRAIRFTRPAPAARVGVYPLYQGGFSSAGLARSFPVPIRNTGELGTDVYDVTVTSAWPAALFGPDGATPLTDTDADGKPDTGAIPQGNSFTVVAVVTTPLGAVTGNANAAGLAVASSLNPATSRTATLQTAVPAPFAQVYQDTSDGALGLYLARPEAQAAKKVTANSFYGYDPAVAETSNGNLIYAWYRSRCLGSPCNTWVSEIEYALFDKLGRMVRSPRKLTQFDSVSGSTYAYLSSVAVAPNGRIGLAWYLYQYNSGTGLYNYNIYLAVLDAAGDIVVPPFNATGHFAWANYNDLYFLRVFYPHLAATGDNRFVIAWTQQTYGPPAGNCTSNCSVSDIVYGVWDTQGNVVRAPTAVTADTPGWEEGYYNLDVTPLAGNRALLTWDRSSDDDVYYAVLDSAGNFAVTITNLTGDGTSRYDYSPEAVQLSDGRALVAWLSWAQVGAAYRYQIRFAALDGAYNRVAGPIDLPNPASLSGDAYLSAVADGAGRAILTWIDDDYNSRRNLYYALVNGSGGVLTAPMIFRTTQSPSASLYTSYEGYGSTSYSSALASSGDGAVALVSALTGGPAGGTANVWLNYSNQGLTPVTGAVLTATLGAELTYAGDTSGIVPQVGVDTVVWTLPQLNFLDGAQFALKLGLPVSATLGARYPITVTLGFAGSDAEFGNNLALGEVMAGLPVFAPLVQR